MVKLELIKDINETKIALSLKFPESNPWANAEERYAVGTVLEGKVARMTDFGAFVELAAGVEGMVHISELSWKRIKHPSDVVKVGDNVSIVGMGSDKSSVVTGVEMFRKLLDEAQAGDNVGALLRGINRTDIQKGQVIAKPGSVATGTEFQAQVYVLKKEEGGRHTAFFNNYRPQFFVRTTDVTGKIELPEGVEMVMPGDNIEMKVVLIKPVALEEGLRFAIREGGRTVGSGVITKLLK